MLHEIIFKALAQGRRTHLLRASISGMMAGSSSASASSFISSAKEGLVFIIARHRSCEEALLSMSALH